MSLRDDIEKRQRLFRSLTDEGMHTEISMQLRRRCTLDALTYLFLHSKIANDRNGVFQNIRNSHDEWAANDREAAALLRTSSPQ